MRVSAMHDAHVAQGASFRANGDWQVPDIYTSPSEEAQRALAAVGLADTSACGKLQLRGAGAFEVVAGLAGTAPIPAGTAARLSLDGVETLACRLAPDAWLVLTTAGDAELTARILTEASRRAGCAHVTDLTAGLTALYLVGPRAPSLLARLVPLDLEPLPPLGVVQGPLARVPAILVRLDRVAAPGFRALVAREYGIFVWEALVHAGHDLGLVPVGAAARARLEAGA